MPTSFKYIGIGLLVTLVSFYFVQRDLRLKIWGKTVIADVMDDYENTARRSKRATGLGITYRFMDEKGEPVLGSANVPLDYKGEKMAPAGEDAAFNDIPRVLAVKVVYLPGTPEIHRLATSSTFWPYPFLLGGLAVLAYGINFFNNESVADAHRQMEQDRMDSSDMEVEDIPKSMATGYLRMLLRMMR